MAEQQAETNDLGKMGEDFLAECRMQQKKAKQLCKEIKSSETSSALETLQKYNEMEMALQDAFNRAGLLQSVHPDKGVRNASEMVEQEMVALMTSFSLDRDLYEVFAKINLDSETLDDQARRLGQKILKDFKRSGVDKDDATRKNITELNNTMTEHAQAFGRNIREDTRFVEISDKSQLEGLPEDFIAAHEADENGIIKISTDFSDFLPVMTYADDDDLRRTLWEKKMNIGFPDNRKTLMDLLSVRFELSNILGYKTYADYATEELMIKTPLNAGSFINKVASLARKRGESDRDTLIARQKQDDPNVNNIKPWQSLYLVRKIKTEQYSFNPKLVRPYFEVQKVLSGILDISSRLFAISFNEVDEKAWHESVKIFEVEKENQVIGKIYLDLYPRENKYKHAAMFPMIGGVKGKRIAEGAIVCNFPDPSKTKDQALLEHNNVTTFFHEFGHLLHHILSSETRWHRFSGVATEWDFVEVPSQLFEEWAWDTKMLQSFATNKAGEAIPEELVEKMRAANEFGKGQQVMQQMAYAAISLGFYDRNPANINIDEFVKQKFNDYSMYPFIEGSHFECGFGHLVEYASNYYTYMWSLVIAKDLYQTFKKAGISDKSTSLAYRDKLLSQGGVKDAGEMVKDFLGREFDFAAFENWLQQGM